MAISETSFADRLQRGRDMQTATAVFTPAFAPADASLAAAAFLTFLDLIDVQNTTVGTLLGQITTGANQRDAMVLDIKDRALRVLSFVKSNAAWKSFLPQIKRLADKIRGYRTARATPPASGEAPGSEPAKKRSQGEQSHGEIKENLEQLVAALGSIPGYAPAAADLTIASLTTLAADYAAKNAAMAALYRQAGMEQKDRLENYDGPSGLREKMKAIKQAVRSQYGSNSAEYQQVKGIAL